MNKDNIISALVGVIIGLTAAVVFTLRVNNPATTRASIVSSTNIGAGNAAVPPSDLSHTNPAAPLGSATAGSAAAAGGGGMQPQVKEALDRARDNPKDVRAQLNAAGMYYQIGQYDEALKFIDTALAAEPDNTSALIAAADTRFEKSDFIGAAGFYERVIKFQPTNANAHVDLGSTFYQRTPPDHDRALALYRRALELEQNHPDALHNLAVIQITRNEKSEARLTVERLAAAHPNHPTLADLRQNLVEP